MHATTVGVDLAKNRFELAIHCGDGQPLRRERLSRRRFVRCFANAPASRVVMEACGSAHHWGRTLQQLGDEVQLLPAQYVGAYVRRNKTDTADAAALLEALETADNGLPDLLRPLLAETLQEVTGLTERIVRLEATLAALTRSDPVVQGLLKLPGVGLLGASALRAAVGDIQRFPSGRHFASWLGLTATERSSGERRRLGRISKRGDSCLRMLLVHGARSALCAAAATRPPLPSPTSSPAPSGQPGAISGPLMAIGH